MRLQDCCTVLGPPPKTPNPLRICPGSHLYHVPKVKALPAHAPDNTSPTSSRPLPLPVVHELLLLHHPHHAIPCHPIACSCSPSALHRPVLHPSVHPVLQMLLLVELVVLVEGIAQGRACVILAALSFALTSNPSPMLLL